MFGFIIYRIYSIIWLLITPFLPIIFIYRLFLNKEELKGIKEKFGINSFKKTKHDLIWINAASLGEARSVIPLIKELLKYNFQILFTTVTSTSAKHVKSILENINNNNIKHQYSPIDHPFILNIFLNYWKPSSIIFIESEIWPNIVYSSYKKNIPLILLQGRMSLRTYKKWLLLKSFAKYIFKKFKIIIAQDNENKTRYTNLGGEKVEKSINLKNYLTAPKMTNELKSKLTKFTKNRFIIVFASIHESIEEETAIISHLKAKNLKSNLLSIIVPRYPKKIKNILKLCKQYNLNSLIRSKSKLPNASTDIYVADTIGELGTFYEQADICFIGGSLASKGGHNLIEPALEKCAIIFGPDVSNHLNTAKILLNNNAALQIHNKDELVKEVITLCNKPQKIENLKNQSYKTIKNIPSPVNEVLKLIKPILKL